MCGKGKVLLLLAAMFARNACANTFDACDLAHGIDLFPGFQVQFEFDEQSEKELLSIVSEKLRAQSKLREDLILYLYKKHQLANSLGSFAKQNDMVAEIVVCDKMKRLADLVWVNLRTKQLLILTPNIKNQSAW